MKKTHNAEHNIIVVEVAASNPKVTGPYFTDLDNAVKMLDRILIREAETDDSPIYWVDDTGATFTIGKSGKYFHHWELSHNV